MLYAMRDNWLNMLYICGNGLCDEGQLAKYAGKRLEEVTLDDMSLFTSFS